MERDTDIQPKGDRPVLLLVGALEVSAEWTSHTHFAVVPRLARSSDLTEASSWIASHWADSIVVDAACLGARAQGTAWLGALRELVPHASVILVGSPSASSADATGMVAALFGAGLGDWLERDQWSTAWSSGRVARWLHESVQRRGRDERSRLVEGACARLTQERRGLEERLGKACADLSKARLDAEEREAVASMRSECNAILSSEVEPAPIIEWSLQYFVARVGPTNVSLFVREGERFVVGGYVRDDLSRRAAGGMLEHLSTGWCQSIAAQRAVLRIADGNPIAPRWVELQGVLPGRSVLAFPCADGELAQAHAVVIAFRDGRRPFGPDLERVGRALGPALGGAIARARRILGRMQPQWPRSPKDQPSE
jgi:hypothetical protein